MDDLDILAELEEMARTSLVLDEPENAEPLPADVTHHQRDMDLEVPPEILNHVPQPPKFGKAKYLVKLENPIHSLEIVHRLGCITMPHEVFTATDEDGDTTKFCKIGEEAKFHILQHFRQNKSRFQPTVIRYNVADKDLFRTSIHPTLGCDATLPQNRITGDDDKRLLPAQNEYPQLGVDVDYREASINGGVLKTWGGKYKALVDAPDGKVPPVKGKAFLAKDREVEETLRTYETDQYEVTRCLIEMADSVEEVRGLTFRFAGSRMR
ncbi:poly polymerase [Colletotrichum asianum]|uniref:Poly polymerase n=1 Tax=Colletotrichum asianum TaxID=702518 RepID=A0A8H3W923_9PEZI|nr:poly polymerase [Colletotrichum asianum]